MVRCQQRSLAIEDYSYRRCAHRAQEFGHEVSLHNDSQYSIETTAFLNEAVKLRFMRRFAARRNRHSDWPQSPN